MLDWKSLEPKYGEEYWDAFSDLCLMWPRIDAMATPEAPVT